MSEREKPSSSSNDGWEEQNTNRGGRKDGGTPDYEKNQSSPNSDKDFDNEKTEW